MATTESAGGQCPECGGATASAGIDTVCETCGLVIATDAIDRGPDWRSFADDDTDPERAYPGDPNRGDRGLGSEMGHAGERDAADERRRTWHTQAKTDGRRARNRNYATSEVERVAAALDLSNSLAEQACAMFRRLQDDGETVGRDLDTLAATCVYSVSRIHQRGVTPDEVGGVARTDARRVARRHTWLCRTLDLATPPPDPRQRIRVVARECGVGDDVCDRAMALLDECDEGVVARGSPSTLAAALVYCAGGDVTQVEVAEAAGVTPAGLRDRRDVLVGRVGIFGG